MKNANLKMIMQNAKILLPLILIAAGYLSLLLADLVRAEEPPKLNPELTVCLKERMGEETFNAIKAGTRQPTADEAKKGEECFSKYGSSLKSAKRPKRPDFSAATKTCLNKTLGANFEKQFENVKSEEEGRRLGEKAKSCFGAPNEAKKIPDSVKQCIIKNAGEAEANKMFAGERPGSDSVTYKKLESAGCFEGFKHGGKEGKMEDVPEEKRQCIRDVIGNLDGEPTEEQRQLIGQKCFGGGAPGGQGRPQIPAEVESCLKEKLGNSFMGKSPDAMSEGERQSAGECFQKHNFRPEGGERMSDKRPDISDSVKQCVERITGQPISARPEIGDDTKNRINSECFGDRADEITGEGGARGKTRSEIDDCVNRITGRAAGPYPSEVQARLNQECYREQQTGNNPNSRAQPDKQACIDRISSDSSIQMSYEEKQKKINAECFAAERYGQPKDENYDQSRAGSDGGAGLPPEENKQRPGGCQDDACVEQYCATNPGACGPRP